MKVLITGDSMIKYMYQYLPSQLYDNKLHALAFPGITIERLTKKISSFNEYDCILFHVGTNNMDSTVDDSVLKYKSLIREVSRVNPYARVVISGILPRVDSKYLTYNERDELRPRLRSVNNKSSQFDEKMIDLCEELDNVTFCMSSRDWSGCMALDGLHLNAAGTRQLATLFVQVLTQLLTESSKSTSKIELRSSLDFPPLCDGGSDILTSSASPLYSEVVAESALSRKLPSQLNVKAPSETEQQLQTREFQQCSSAAVTQKNLKENSELSSFLRKSAHPDPNGWIHVGRKRFTQNIEQCCQFR
ncbi:platelet-activating factor acetylhydrolase IB subunit beta-like isoform X1 [Stegodyphus dumicola]|uniref:platelet-activating factor acetylhydrolase IB subunit beta-like isoform X1 n=1 Tax=Stegodyphus dumicola TaxID=202533 RepID=UPI0015AFE06D|nr:platelet-activating factor acetylhydrolase IB subunit beta-like isoform X1 [Stegodyphus dumicola]